MSYLTSPTKEAPRLTYEQLEGFLFSVAYEADAARPRLMSGSRDWVAQLRSRAGEALDMLPGLSPPLREDIVEPERVRYLLAPLAEVLANYAVYVVPVGAWRDTEVLDRFSNEAARLPGHAILVLIPDYYDGGSNVRVLGPSDGTAEAIANRHLWPGAVFLLSSGESRFYPLEDAHARLIELAQIFSDDGDSSRREERIERARGVLASSTKAELQRSTRRIFHLSDLHFGRERAAENAVLLQAALKPRLRSQDRIVITGDLFDQPRRRHARDFRTFRNTLQLLSGNRPIVVPGNHDQRFFFGNSFFGLGRRIGQIAKLDWQPLVVDPENRLLFFCFDSARSGDFARGRVDTDQLLEMATQDESGNAGRQYADYLRVALIHHHPYAYMPDKEVPIVDPRGWVGREEFLKLEGADQFLSWCAGRHVELILHGHKHIPRLIPDWIMYGDATSPNYSKMMTVGCGSSLGAGGKPLSFNVVDWEPQSQSWTVDFQIDRGDGQGFFSAAVEGSPINAA